MLRLLIGLLAFIALPAFAAPTATTAHLTIALASESLTPAPGRAVMLALDVKPRPGWHIYWQNPGDAGLPPEIMWQLPDGVRARPLRHPIPSLLTVQGITSIVHEGETVLLSDLRLPATARPGTRLPITADLQWLVCSDTLCVPERAALTLDLTVGQGTPDPAAMAIFDRARATQPAPIDQPAHYAMQNGKLTLFLPIAPPADLKNAQVFISESNILSLKRPQVARHADSGILIESAAGSASLTGAVHGVLRLDRAGGAATGLVFTATPGKLPAGGAVIGQPAGSATSLASFALALGGAILGGLILNLMPCVFPILSLKALSLARAGESEAAARRDAIAYTVGAVLVLVALGGIILLLRSGGAEVGWAFQLQDVHVVGALLLLSFGIALNLAGLFELPTIAIGQNVASRGGVTGSFLTGALAAFVATPCTGPFMAGALGAALLLPPAQALAIFAGLGVGLALPFLAIGYIPALRSRLPRPGNWMVTLRHILSLPMFLTALGLAWVIGRQAGTAAMTIALAATLLLGLALWWLGLRQARARTGWPALLPALVAIAGLVLLPAANPQTQASATPMLLNAQPYSAASLAALRAQRRGVFVYLTADWCLSCKVNEASSLSSPDVAEAFRTANIATLEGDWTRGDAEVGRLLAHQGRAGVPLYLFYPANGDQPRELPQVLTPSMLIALARR